MRTGKCAWLYCAIDAPEDNHNALKGQRQQLMDYAEQMNFEVVGSSSDVGGEPFLERLGFCEFINQVKSGSVDILLIATLHSIGCTSMQLTQFEVTAKSLGFKVYSPMIGAMKSCQ